MTHCGLLPSIYLTSNVRCLAFAIQRQSASIFSLIQILHTPTAMTLSISDASSVLPTYTPCAIVPAYSPEASQDERVIEHRPRRKPRTFTGNYSKKAGRDTVVLAAQDEYADVPTYARSALVEGFVSLEGRELVSEISLKVKGEIELMVSGALASKTILSEQYCLWSERSDGVCPSTVPFSTILPAHFEHSSKKYPLPPSYFASYASSGGLYSKVVYVLSVTVTRARRRKLSFLPSKNTVVIPFNYSPRMCPARPICLSGSDFLADVKVMPEEWHQLSLSVAPRPKVQLPAIDLHLFTPASDVFALSEPIAVHVQLIGPVVALREFLPDPAVARATAHSRVEVALVRQMRLHINGSVEHTVVTTGRAVLHPTPPGVNATSDDGNPSLDWAGELCVDPAAAAVGSFDAAVLQVQDFIVVDVLEPAGHKSRYAHMRRSRPIRLVTDPWPPT
ncbi:hypothetical protein C8R45DRAFT_894886 [Mycena sanguinolenta]|nr:hypothetical protein C8R45DRAFT_894886 [Mycena sanguinolenta]